jgi:hypothetical protein
MNNEEKQKIIKGIFTKIREEWINTGEIQIPEEYNLYLLKLVELGVDVGYDLGLQERINLQKTTKDKILEENLKLMRTKYLLHISPWHIMLRNLDFDSGYNLAIQEKDKEFKKLKEIAEDYEDVDKKYLFLTPKEVKDKIEPRKEWVKVKDLPTECPECRDKNSFEIVSEWNIHQKNGEFIALILQEMEKCKRCGMTMLSEDQAEEYARKMDKYLK